MQTFPTYASLRQSLGPAWTRRVRLAFVTPLFMSSAIAMFSFFAADHRILAIFTQKILSAFCVDGGRGGGGGGRGVAGKSADGKDGFFKGDGRAGNDDQLWQLCVIVFLAYGVCQTADFMDRKPEEKRKRREKSHVE